MRLERAPLHSYIQICILEYHWSPEEIVGRIQLEHGCRLVSVPTIYRAIHAGLLNPPGASAKFVLRKLRHHRKRRHKKGREERCDKFVISPPSKIVLPAQRTVPSEATGKQIPWWASKERHALSCRWTERAGTCLAEKPRARLPLPSTSTPSMRARDQREYQWASAGILPGRQGHHGYTRGLHPTEVS